MLELSLSVLLFVLAKQYTPSAVRATPPTPPITTPAILMELHPNPGPALGLGSVEKSEAVGEFCWLSVGVTELDLSSCIDPLDNMVDAWAVVDPDVMVGIIIAVLECSVF